MIERVSNAWEALTVALGHSKHSVNVNFYYDEVWLTKDSQEEE